MAISIAYTIPSSREVALAILNMCSEMTSIALVVHDDVIPAPEITCAMMVNPGNDFNYAPSLIQLVLLNKPVDVAIVGMHTQDMVESDVRYGATKMAESTSTNYGAVTRSPKYQREIPRESVIG
ncbi:hypothetical protein [Rhizobium mayense]|uniref:Uncharacterized protein n=1 Tax=Rhizobium mayense TaxID=1312184 RepID=A0ABT7K2Y9_9HYPH|nr:hypothetical protein [Rhizobium mayense]MDL2402866.1 hypothetical protein [Rhizobium mayense]